MIPNPLLPFDAPERAGDVLQLPVPVGVNYPAGNLIAVDGTGTAQLADDVAGLHVVGRAETDVVAGIDIFEGTAIVRVKRGTFQFGNSLTNPVTQAMIGQPAFVQDCRTVCAAAGSQHAVKAGVVIEVNSLGVFIDTRPVIGG